MATQATLEKLQDLVGVNDMTVSEIKFVLKHWESAPKRLYGNVVKSVKVLDRIPPSVQVDFVTCSDKAVRALGELICPEAQDLVVADFAEDIPQLVRRAVKLPHISEGLWKVLVAVVRGGKYDVLLTTAVSKKLVQRKDCPPTFAKALGLTRDEFEKAQRKGSTTKTRAPQTVKVRPVDEDAEDADDDFEDVRRVAKAVRTAKR